VSLRFGRKVQALPRQDFLTLPGNTDFSQNYNELRQQLDVETKGAYRAFVGALKPDFRQVWIDIGMGWLAIALTLLALPLFRSPLQLAAALPLGAAMIGYIVAYFHLFLHEAAHYNLAADRTRNDRLCDVFISWLTGLSIADYRVTHFQHHRKLGETDDSERSYFNALTSRFLLETLTGLHAVGVFLTQMQVVRNSKTDNDARRSQKSRWPLIRGLLAHAALLLILLKAGAWPSAVAWVIGVAVFFPLFSALRQILEHRASDSDPAADYGQVPHGAVTRLFGDDLFSRTFGGAGFNRHLLHHWEPQISYTCLGDFEKFLMTTSAGPVLDSRRSTYWRTFREIMSNDNAARRV
jgi:fatty acid desaturase